MKAKIIEKEATPEQKERLSNDTAKIETIYKELRPPKPKAIEPKQEVEEEIQEEPEKKTCTICGIKKVFEHFPNKSSRCRDCTSYIKTQEQQGRKVDIQALKEVNVDFEAMYREMKEEKPSEEGNPNNSNVNPIISELIDVLNSFHTNINKFAYMPDIKKFMDLGYLRNLLDWVQVDITKIKNILED
jgi:DNA repair exonuclease SbcCD ATPase subunit